LTKLHEAEAALKGFNYDQWGTDELKDAVASQNLDIALVYSGDFFDTLYATIEADVPVTFDMYVPNKNNVWFDAMVIPVTSKNPDLAHKFINYFQNEEVAYENAAYIGYCPTILNVYNQLLEDPEMKDFVTHQGYYPGSITDGEIYRYLGENIALEMDSILNRVKIH
jgi:spermidine/putrescine-binding protein